MNYELGFLLGGITEVVIINMRVAQRFHHRRIDEKSYEQRQNTSVFYQDIAGKKVAHIGGLGGCSQVVWRVYIVSNVQKVHVSVGHSVFFFNGRHIAADNL